MLVIIYALGSWCIQLKRYCWLWAILLKSEFDEVRLGKVWIRTWGTWVSRTSWHSRMCKVTLGLLSPRNPPINLRKLPVYGNSWPNFSSAQFSSSRFSKREPSARPFLLKNDEHCIVICSVIFYWPSMLYII